MVKKTKKNIIFTFIILLSLASVTYARHSSLGFVKADPKIATWSIKINGENVSTNSTFLLNDLVWTETENVADGYVAPGGSGYYNINLDTTDTKVAVDYTIGFDSLVLEENSRMTIDKITFDDVEVTFDDGYYDGYIPLEDVLNNKVINIKIYITWEDSTTDEEIYEDMDSALNYTFINLPMFISVRQHLDESSENVKDSLVTQLLSYKETLLEVDRPTSGIIITPFYKAQLDSLYENPERGMYSSNTLTLSKSGNSTKDMYAKVSKLLYLKVDLSAFSAWRNGTDQELTQNALDTLKSQLEIIKQHNNTVLLRFVYDNNATAIYNNNKTKFEPQQAMLVRHIEQMASIFQEYASTIYTIQVGFYGLWGESFYNTDVNSHPEYYKQTMEALLDATQNTDIIIALRTPSYARGAINSSSYDTSRVGVFNDAYLSQNDDMGTFKNRDEETAWLNSRNTSYGGEALPATFTDTSETKTAYEDYYVSGKLNEYIDSIKTKTNNWDLISYTEDEMYKTHTSYMNFEWNQYKHYIWSSLPYNGKDKLYQGKTALEYIQSHLGYRLVLKNVELPRKANASEEIDASITIENVGFGNVLKNKNATLLFVDSNNIVVESLNITDKFNIKDFTSRNKIKKILTINLPNLSSGKYSIYLRIANDEILNDGTYYSAIRFANNSIWNSQLQANLIGNIKIN